MARTDLDKDSARPEEVAAYVAMLARELMQLTHRHDLALLSYLLDMVRAEAEERAERKPN
jgi:hypothetical protein